MAAQSTPLEYNFRFAWNEFSGTIAIHHTGGTGANAEALLDTGEDPWAPLMSWSTPEGVARQTVYSYLKRRSRRDGRATPQVDDVEICVQADGLGAGAYYPRVWRPRRGAAPGERVFRTDSKVALGHLEVLAREMFGVVEPEHHLDAYGHRTRQLLLLACMEVENSCRAVLDANRYRFPGNPSTNDYVKVAVPLGLNRCALELIEYPSIAALSPFQAWPSSTPTQALTWYDAYNATKHSRQTDFSRATLGAALTALAGAWAVHAMQFGPSTVVEDSAMFTMRKWPAYGTERGYLFPAFGGVATPAYLAF